MKKPQNYYLEILSQKRAIELFKTGTVEIFKVFDDNDTQAKIESEHDLHDAIDLGIEIAVKRLIH